MGKMEISGGNISNVPWRRGEQDGRALEISITDF